ncbi:glycosyl transferase family 2 [Fulvitalea axinellae]|uniref:Glycosyl transferase family 2 n=1 Tax=Fulvitalea axinellae TaxID=1182444 RepID=A0AAU9D7R9_9BACT|nr:glycosyl transferase family 2 [Fulvitalea axinellae]
MPQPLISVVIPFYQPKKLFDRCLKSIRSQTYQNFELILVDNNADNLSRRTAVKHVNADSRITLVKEEKQGVVFASNKGMSLAKGDFLVRMDADDFMAENRLERQYEYLCENPECGAVSCLVEFVGDDEAKGFKTYVDWLNSVQSFEEIKLSRFVESPIANPTTMVRKEVPEKLGWYRDGDFPEDYELWLRWIESGVRIDKTPERLHFWVDSKERLTRTDNRYDVDAFFKIKSKYLAQSLAEKKIQEVCVWGAGRKSRQRLEHLTQHGIKVIAYLDFKEREIHGIPCFDFRTYDFTSAPFILTYVSNRGKRDEIKSFLKSKGLREGEDFLCVG